MSLARIGFTEGERYPCLGWADARLGARAEIHGEKAVLLLSTGVRLDVALDGSYVHRRGFPVLRHGNGFDVCALTDFHALGRGRPHETAVFFSGDESGAPDYAGAIGVEYFKDGLLGLDAAGPTAGLSTEPSVRECFTSAVCRLPMVPDAGSGLPVTVAIRELNAPDARLALLVHTGLRDSYLTWSYVRANWCKGRSLRAAERALRRRGVVDVELELPRLGPLRVQMRIAPAPPNFVVDVGVNELHGVLGIDVLRRWMQVFDFPGRELALFDY